MRDKNELTKNNKYFCLFFFLFSYISICTEWNWNTTVSKFRHHIVKFIFWSNMNRFRWIRVRRIRIWRVWTTTCIPWWCYVTMICWIFNIGSRSFISIVWRWLIAITRICTTIVIGWWTNRWWWRRSDWSNLFARSWDTLMTAGNSSWWWNSTRSFLKKFDLLSIDWMWVDFVTVLLTISIGISTKNSLVDVLSMDACFRRIVMNDEIRFLNWSMNRENLW